MTRYLRAFFTALQMTLRGETPPPQPYSELTTWMDNASRLVDAISKAADGQKLDQQSIKVRVDGRNTSMIIVLAAIKHHMAEEYPYLLRHTTRNNIAAIHASNSNDQYRIGKLEEILQPGTVKAAVAALKTHLEAIPPQQEQ